MSNPLFNYRPAKQQTEKETISIEEENPYGFNFSSANERLDTNEKDQSMIDYLSDIGTQLFSRGIEKIVGLPKDLTDFARGVLTGEVELPEKKYLPQALTNVKSDVEKIKPLFESDQSQSLGTLPSVGSQEIRQFSKEITGKKSEPKDVFQESLNESFDTFLDLALPGTKGFRGAKSSKIGNLSRKIGTAVLSQIPPEVLKSYGFEKNEQDKARLGTTIGLSLALPAAFGQRSVQNVYKSLYDKRDKLINSSDVINAKNLQNNLNKLKEELKGIQTESTKPIVNSINDVESLIKNNQITSGELLENLRRINENRGNLYSFDIPKGSREKLKKNYAKLYSTLNNEFETYARNVNPEALAAHKQANEVFGAYNQSKKLSNYIGRQAKKYQLHAVPAAVFGVYSGGLPLTAKALAGAGVGTVGVKTFEALNRIFESPTLSKYYSEVIKNAARENSLGTVNSLKKFNEEYEKSSK